MAGRRTSRAAALAKLVLPLLALAVLSTLFLFADRSGPPPLPYSEAEIDALAREMRLGAPRYAAVTGDGAALVVSAAEVRPGRRAERRARSRPGYAIPTGWQSTSRRLTGSSTPWRARSCCRAASRS